MKKLTINGIVQLIKLGAEQGISRQKMLLGSNISAEMLADPYSSIEPEQEFQVVHTLLEQVNDAAFGLVVGERFRLSVLGILGAAVPNAANVHEAIQFFIRFINLSYTYFDVSFKQGAEGATIRLADKIELGDLRRFFIDRDVMFTLTAFRDLFPKPVPLAGLKLKMGYETPTEIMAYHEKIPCPLAFGEGDTIISLDQSVLKLPLQQSNELTLKLLEKQCVDVDAKLAGKESISERITQLLLTDLRQPAPLEYIAEQLALSTRTVRRRLDKEGLQFQKLLNELRCKEAKRLLAETAWSIEKIAETLGYSESAGFIHAFKDWTNSSPTGYRKQQSATRSEKT